jgi:hypothetical protein
MRKVILACAAPAAPAKVELIQRGYDGIEASLRRNTEPD